MNSTSSVKKSSHISGQNYARSLLMAEKRCDLPKNINHILAGAYFILLTLCGLNKIQVLVFSIVNKAVQSFHPGKYNSTEESLKAIHAHDDYM